MNIKNKTKNSWRLYLQSATTENAPQDNWSHKRTRARSLYNNNSIMYICMFVHFCTHTLPYWYVGQYKWCQWQRNKPNTLRSSQAYHSPRLHPRSVAGAPNLDPSLLCNTFSPFTPWTRAHLSLPLAECPMLTRQDSPCHRHLTEFTRRAIVNIVLITFRFSWWAVAYVNTEDKLLRIVFYRRKRKCRSRGDKCLEGGSANDKP